MKRGEIWLVDLEPTHGREQAGKRPVLIVSPEKLNRAAVPIVCPITGGGAGQREHGFAVSLSGAGTSTTGVVLCHQVRALDLKERKAKKVEMVPDYIIDEVLGRIATIFE